MKDAALIEYLKKHFPLGINAPYTTRLEHALRLQRPVLRLQGTL